MSLLLKEIMRRDKEAADVLRGAGLNTDKDLQLLTPQDLQELFPGTKTFRLRRDIFDIIHKQKPVERLLRELKEFIPDQSFRDALTNNGVLVDYLQILKDMKSQMNNVQSFLDAHIGLLEEFSTNQPDQKSTRYDPVKSQSGQPAGCPQMEQDSSDSGFQMVLQTGDHPQGAQDSSDSGFQMVPPTGGQQQGAKGTGFLQTAYRTLFPGSTGGTSTSAICDPVEPHNGQIDVCPRGERGAGASDASHQTAPPIVQIGGHPRRAQTVLMYQMVVAGKTFDAHLQLMDKVKHLVQDQFLLLPSDQDYQFTFVFCPISSRIASDVEAAMADVKGDKPVILVLMHHTRETRYTTTMKTWREKIEVILHVNVFYHETVYGLLKCDQNTAAASEIQNKLLECFMQRSEVTSGNAQAVGAESVLTGSTSGRDGNTKRFATDRSSNSRGKKP